MPEHVRQGLVENAGGQLMCPWPKCRLPVWLLQTVTAVKPYTVYSSDKRVTTVSAQDAELDSDFAVVLYIKCEQGHASHVAFETKAGGTHTETWWDDDPEDAPEQKEGQP